MGALEYIERDRYSAFVTGLTSGSNSAASANTSRIQAAIDALASAGSRDTVQIPPGTYYSNKLIRRGGVGLRGVSRQGTTLILANGANTDLLVDERYETDVLFAQEPCTIRDLTLDGNRTNNTSGSGWIGQTYQSTIRDVTFQNFAHEGEIITTVTKSGSNIGNGTADNRHEHVRYENNGRGGFYAKDSANRLADQFFDGCVFNGNGSASYAQFRADRFAGFVVSGSRFYNGFAGGDMDLTRFSIAQLLGNHFEFAARSSPNTTAQLSCVRIRSMAGSGFRWATIVGNLFWMQATNKTATDVYSLLYFDQVSEALVLAGNVFQADSGISTRRAVDGASTMVGVRYPNTFVNFTGAQLGSAWNNWGSTTLPTDAVDDTTAQALANALKDTMQLEGLSR